MQPTWQAPQKIAKGEENHHVIYTNKGAEPIRLVKAYIHSPEHVPPIDPEATCEHDAETIRVAHGYCHLCNFDETTRQYRHAVEIYLTDKSGRVLARTSLISKAPHEETDIHVEQRAYVAPGDEVQAHFIPRGDGHEIPADFAFRLVFN